MKALQVTLGLGLHQRFRDRETPLMWIDKAQTWEMAGRLGGAPLVELIRLETHSCYLGATPQARVRHGVYRIARALRGLDRYVVGHIAPAPSIKRP